MEKKMNRTATVILLLGSFVVLFPLYLTASIALKSPHELARSLVAPPLSFHWENFVQAIRMTNFFRSFLNSAAITVGAVILTLLTNSMVAYAVARNMHRRYYRFLYYYFISAMFIPFAIIMLPIVKETCNMGLDNKIGLVFLYTVYGLAMNIFVYVGYIKSIPVSMDEAAFIDGCNVWQVFWKMIFPLMGPINATVGILTMLWAWNDFMLPLVLLSRPEDATLPLVQFIFQSQYDTNYNLAFASYLMALSPMILVYVVAQKRIIRGVMHGSIK